MTTILGLVGDVIRIWAFLFRIMLCTIILGLPLWGTLYLLLWAILRGSS